MTDHPVVGAMRAGLDLVDEAVSRLEPPDWQRPSPCEDWTVGDVLGHVTGTVGKATTILADAGEYAGVPAAPEAGASPDELRTAWADAAGRARKLLAAADLDRVVSTPRGEQPLAVALALPTADLAVHAWDISAGAGKAVELPESLIAHVRRVVEAVPQEALRRPGLFGPELPAPADASPTAEIMAWLGRSAPHA